MNIEVTLQLFNWRDLRVQVAADAAVFCSSCCRAHNSFRSWLSAADIFRCLLCGIIHAILDRVSGALSVESAQLLSNPPGLQLPLTIAFALSICVLGFGGLLRSLMVGVLGLHKDFKIQAQGSRLRQYLLQQRLKLLW